MLENKGRTKRSLVTVYGEIVFFRTFLTPSDSSSMNALLSMQKEKGVFPLDDYLGISNLPFKMTVKMMVSIAKEAVRATSYERAALMVLEHYRVQLSAATIRKVTDYVGSIVFLDDTRRAQQALSSSAEKIDRRKKHRTKDDVLYLEMDGAMFNTRLQKEGTSWMECKIGIAFHAKDLRSWETKKGETRRRITKKRLVGYIGNYNVFKGHMLALASRYNYRYCSKIVVISDGADWIHTLTQELFPDAVHILDLSHVKEHVGDFGKWINEDEEEAKKWIGKINGMIEQSEIDGVLELLKPYKDCKCPKNILNLYTYIVNHKSCMDYKLYKEKGYFVGSGASESANKYAMQNRMKLQGMRWNKESGQNMLALKTRLESDCWHEIEPLVAEYCNK